MKINLLIALLLICGVAKAQTLKLKKGQKFNYEAINEVELNDEYKNIQYGYLQSKLEVTGRNKDTYTLKISPSIILTKWGDDILDSTVPFEEQPALFIAITNKVLTMSSFDMTVDHNGTIISTSGLPKIRSDIATKLEALKIPEDHQKHADLLNQICTEDFFKRYGAFFNDKGAVANRNAKSGLISTYSIDTTTKNFSPEGVLTSSPHARKRFSLITSKDQPLLKEAKERLKYADYYLPVAQTRRKILELAALFNREKGSQTVEDRILKQLDSLDKGFAKDDYQYMGAKLLLLTYLNGGDYRGILHKVPYEYLPHENDIDNKLAHDLEKGDFSNVKKAIELSFTKFKGTHYYPMNMSNTSESIHDNFGGLIFKMQNKDSLQKVYQIIDDLDNLKNPVVTDMLKGLKTYVKARLATDQKELAEIANTHFNSVYDMAGRYRILIYDELVKKQIPDSIKLAYIDYTIDVNQNRIDQINSGKIENVSRYSLENRLKHNIVVYKKNLADAYYRKSKLKKNDAVSYLQMAAEYLPTQQDISDNEYGLKNEYKFTPFIAYTDLFLASGGTSGMTEEAKLSKYVDMVILEPERYAILKDNYMKVYPKGDFKSFFSNALKSKLPAVPKFSLNERSGKVVANKDQQNKFVFVDFWGTWCGACIAEIDKIEKVHLNNPAPEKLLVTTIACYDKKKNVDDFMAKEKYTYEVLMSDGKVENDFKIRSYPTKLLLLPNGVYLTISFYSNYEDILNKYLKWEI